MKWNDFADVEVSGQEELIQLYQTLLPQLKERTLLLLSGPVGAGKTTSVQILCRLLNMTDVASPSFALHHRYENADGRAVDHLDLYRIDDDDDLESSGFWDLFAQTQSLIIVEWADRLHEDILPVNWPQVRIHIEPIEGKPRSRHVLIQLKN